MGRIYNRIIGGKEAAKISGMLGMLYQNLLDAGCDEKTAGGTSGVLLRMAQAERTIAFT